MAMYASSNIISEIFLSSLRLGFPGSQSKTWIFFWLNQNFYKPTLVNWDIIMFLHFSLAKSWTFENRCSSSISLYVPEFIFLKTKGKEPTQLKKNNPLVTIHSLPKVKHGEENANFRKSIRIEEDAIRCRGRWKYANMLGNSQSRFHVKKYAKRAVL